MSASDDRIIEALDLRRVAILSECVDRFMALMGYEYGEYAEPADHTGCDRDAGNGFNCQPDEFGTSKHTAQDWADVLANIYQEAWDEVIAAHLAEIIKPIIKPIIKARAVEALRDAALAIIPEKYRDDPEMCPTIFDPWDVATYLDYRADQIEATS